MKLLYPAAWAAGVVLSFALPFVPSAGCWAVLALSFILWAAVSRRRAAYLSLCLLFGAAYGVWRTEAALMRQPEVSATVEAIDYRLRVTGLQTADRLRTVFTAEVSASDGRIFRARLSDYQRRDWPPGSGWEVRLRLRPPVGERNLRGLNREAQALSAGIDAFGTVGKERQSVQPSAGIPAVPTNGILRYRAAVGSRWQAADDGGLTRGTALMRALSIGEQSALDSELWQAFRVLGVNHLVSISGLHISLIAVLAGFLMKCLLGMAGVCPKRPRAWMLAAGMVAAVFYAAMAGFAVPTVRALVMTAVLSAAWISGGRVTAWQAWWTALVLVLLMQPSAVLAAGTWLSFGVVAVLLWVFAWRTGRAGVWRSAVRGQWAAAWAVFAGTGFLFAALPLFGPLVNAVAIPWFSWVLVPLALAATLFPFEPLQYAAAWLGEQTLRVLLWLADYAPEWSVAAAPLPLLVLAVFALLLFLLPRGFGLKPFSCIVLAGFFLYREPPPPTGSVRAEVVDVGQGLAVLLQTASKTLLFDTGTPAAAQTQTVPLLRARGIQSLDMLVLSHHDNDHDGGAEAVRRLFEPSEVRAGQPEFYAGANSCREEEAWTWDGVHFEFLHTAGANGGDNDQSCVLRVLTEGGALMVTGDLGADGEAALVGRYGKALQSRLLVLGHHGSSSSSSGVFLNAVEPDFGIASSGFNNAFRHPSAEVRKRLGAHGIRLLRTDRQGALRFQWDSRPPAPPELLPRAYWQKKPFDGE